MPGTMPNDPLPAPCACARRPPAGATPADTSGCRGAPAPTRLPRRALLAGAVAAWLARALPLRASPLPIAGGLAPVTPANTYRDPVDGVLLVELVADPARAALPVIDPDRTGPEAAALRRLALAGRAAGLAGVIYDNRDRGHSALPAAAFPQLSRSDYGASFVAVGLDYGVAGRVRFPLPVIGNSSTARTRGPLPRSLGRLALEDQGAALRSYGLYAANHLYVYPAHRDHDPGRGDRLSANTPLFLLSQGSSGSDRPFLDAFALCLAAFPPETMARLQAAGLVAPTAQMLLRRTLAGVEGAPAAYLSPAAHPPVFDAARLRPEALVAAANSLAADAIPPMVRLEMLSDFDGQPGRDFLDENRSETLFTTPTAIARAWRSYDFTRRVTLGAGSTVDPNGRALRFHWVILQGDPDRIRIRPRDPVASVADIEIDWHAPPPAASGLVSSRIDLAVFADNGSTLSAPATVSVTLPLFQNRVYAPGPAGASQLRSLDYRADAGGSAVDRAIWATGDWEDRLVYDRDGVLAGYDRTGPTGATLRLRYALDGLRLAEDGRAARVHHVAEPAVTGALAYAVEPPGAAGAQ